MPLVLIHTGIVKYLWQILILYSIQFAYPTYPGSPFSDEIAIMIRHYVIHLYLKIRHYVIHPTILSCYNCLFKEEESFINIEEKCKGLRGNMLLLVFVLPCLEKLCDKGKSWMLVIDDRVSISYLGSESLYYWSLYPLNIKISRNCPKFHIFT